MVPNLSPSIVATAIISGSFLIRNGLRRALQGTQFSIVEEGYVLAREWHWYQASKVALIIIDATHYPEHVIEAVQTLRQKHPDARVVALVDQLDLGLLQSGCEAGVESFCLAASDPEVLINVLELTMLGETFVSGSLLQHHLNQAHLMSDAVHTPIATEVINSGPKIRELSPRETVILQFLMRGAPNKAIARDLNITETTIKVHVKAIMRKISVSNRTQAALWANENLRLEDHQPQISN